MYDYRFLKEDLGSWIPWSDQLKDVPPIPKDTQFNSIIVPTVDTVRYTYLMDLLVKHEKPCLFVGPTGTGKSVYVQVRTFNANTMDFLHGPFYFIVYCKLLGCSKWYGKCGAYE